MNDLLNSRADELFKDGASSFRGHIRSCPLREYDQLEETERSVSGGLERWLRSVTEKGWRRDGTVVDLRSPLDWNSHTRTHQFHLHAWEPLGILLPGFSLLKDVEALKLSIGIAEDWLDNHQAQYFSQGVQSGLQAALADETTMAWYDMSVGQRVPRLAYLLDVVARQDGYDDLYDSLFRSLVFQMEMLSIDTFWKSHNNHGLYQALGQLAAARRFRNLPGFSSYNDLATVRVEKMLRDQFFESGVHVEHSPAYHQMILGSVSGALRCGLIEDPKLAETIARAEKALLWMRSPDGSLATFGDTDYQPKTVSEATLPSGIVAYPDAGYVFARQPGDLGMNDASYFAQMAGFHSRAHKHADHGTYIWADNGSRVLIDPGKYGYGPKTTLGDDLSNQGFYYSDPKRIYVEKTSSHNCVEIDGVDHARKRGKVFGSGLLFASEQNGLWVTLSEFRHQKVRHFRLLIVSPRSFLLTIDWLKDGEGVGHDFRQWFQLAPEWKVERQDGGIKATTADGLQLSAASLVAGPSLENLQSGETDPSLAGWVSNGPLSLVPATSVNWVVQQAQLTSFATIFSFGQRLSTNLSKSYINESITRGELVWSSDAGLHHLSFDRSTKDNAVTVRSS